MLASNGAKEHREFVFIHIQKTGGLSVEECLKGAVPDATHYPPRHMGARHARKILADWDERFAFAFVRNPWDRLVSWYSMIEKGRRFHEGSPLPARRLKRIQSKPLLRHTLEVLEEDPSFESFVKYCTTREFRHKGVTYSYTRNQIEYLMNQRGELLVDFVGRFERLRGDLAAVFSRVGLEPSLVENTLPHKNKTLRGHYRDFYTSETESIVREKFTRDIEYFGYEF